MYPYNFIEDNALNNRPTGNLFVEIKNSTPRLPGQVWSATNLASWLQYFNKLTEIEIDLRRAGPFPHLPGHPLSPVLP